MMLSTKVPKKAREQTFHYDLCYDMMHKILIIGN